MRVVRAVFVPCSVLVMVTILSSDHCASVEWTPYPLFSNTACRLGPMNDPHLRFSSTTTYTGYTRQHDYTITVRHSPWRTKVVALSIDGNEQLQLEPDPPYSDQTDTELPLAEGPIDEAIPEAAQSNVEVRVGGWLAVRITVKRPNDEGELNDDEVIHVSTAALGGAGEVEVHSGLSVAPLLPEPGSRSKARDLKRSAKPNTFALIAGLTTATRLIVPLLGLGALFAFITEPIKKWFSKHLTPILEPIFAWLGHLLEPVGRLLTAIGRFIGRVIDFLFGWVPSFQLPFDVPDWVWPTVRIALLAFVAYSVSRSNLKRRQKRLEDARVRASNEPS